MGSIKHAPGHPCCGGGDAGPFLGTCCQMSTGEVASYGPLFAAPSAWVVADCPDVEYPDSLFGDLLLRLPDSVSSNGTRTSGDLVVPTWDCDTLCGALASGLLLPYRQHAVDLDPTNNTTLGGTGCWWWDDFYFSGCTTSGFTPDGWWVRAWVSMHYYPPNAFFFGSSAQKGLSLQWRFRADDGVGVPFTTTPPGTVPSATEEHLGANVAYIAPAYIDLTGSPISTDSVVTAPTQGFHGCEDSGLAAPPSGWLPPRPATLEVA